MKSLKFQLISNLDFFDETLKWLDCTIFRLSWENRNWNFWTQNVFYYIVMSKLWRENSKLKQRALKNLPHVFRLLGFSTLRAQIVCLSNFLSYVFRDVCFMTERSIIWSWLKPIYGKILARLSLEKGLLTLRKEREKKITTTHDIFLETSKTMSVEQDFCTTFNWLQLTNNWWLRKKSASCEILSIAIKSKSEDNWTHFSFEDYLFLISTFW